MNDSKAIHPAAPANRALIIWLAAMILRLALLGASDKIRTAGRRRGGVDTRGLRPRPVGEQGRKVLLIEGEMPIPALRAQSSPRHTRAIVAAPDGGRLARRRQRRQG